MTAANVADRAMTRPAALARLLAAALALLLFAGIEAGAGAPVDPVPNPRVRPGNAPPPGAVQPAKAAAATTAVGRRVNKGDPLTNINAYFNSFRTMEGDFVQFGPRGEQSEGKFYISRPGKIRFHYSPPVRLDVIADGRNVAVRNGRTATQDYYPLKKTPLRYLIADEIDLTSGVVNEVRQDSDFIALVIVEDSRLVKGKLTLIFDSNTYELKQWIVTDAQGLNTSVALYNTKTGRKIDPSLFNINYYQ